MDELQRILEEWLSFFFKEGRYKVTDSKTGSSFNDALIDFSSDRLTWRLVNDKAQFFLSCRSSHGRYKDWERYSVDLLRWLLEGKKSNSAVLTQEMSEWVSENLSAIEEKFSLENLSNTKAELDKLEKLRAKALFG